MAETGKSEIIAELEGMALFQGMKSLFSYLFEKGTGKIKEELKPFVYGNEETIDGLFKRAITKVTSKGVTVEDRAIYHRVLVTTIHPDRQNDYRRFMVASCFGHKKLKEQSTIEEDDLIDTLANMIIEDVKIAVAYSHLLDAQAKKESEWMSMVRFYDLDQSLDAVLDEYERELDRDITNLQAKRPRLIKWLLGT